MASEIKTKADLRKAFADYEEVIIRVHPNVIRFIKEFLGEKPKEWIEQQILEDIEAEIDAMTGKEIKEYFGLEHILKE